MYAPMAFFMDAGTSGKLITDDVFFFHLRASSAESVRVKVLWRYGVQVLARVGCFVL